MKENKTDPKNSFDRDDRTVTPSLDLSKQCKLCFQKAKYNIIMLKKLRRLF